MSSNSYQLGLLTLLSFYNIRNQATRLRLLYIYLYCGKIIILSHAAGTGGLEGRRLHSLTSNLRFQNCELSVIFLFITVMALAGAVEPRFNGVTWACELFRRIGNFVKSRERQI